MVKTVIKRNGTKERFDTQKITNAIYCAYKGTSTKKDIEVAKKIAKCVEQSPEEELTINEIQKRVEAQLMAENQEVGTSYIVYRENRDKNRRLVQTYDAILETNINDVKNENANINGNTPSGQMTKFASAASTDHAENRLISKKFEEVKNSGYIHSHDFDYYSTASLTCTQIDLEEILAEGFNTENGYIKEPQNITSAMDLAAIILQSNQNQQHGGQAIPCWDHPLTKYVKRSFKKHFLTALLDNFANTMDLQDVDPNDPDQYKKLLKDLENDITPKFGEIEFSNEKLQKKFSTPFKIGKRNTVLEVRQATKGFVYNMNTMKSRGGGQVVFSSINTGTDFSEEGRLINKCLLDRIYAGLGKGETSIFPIVIWKIKEQVNWDDEDFELALTDPLKAMNGDLKFKTPNFDLTIYSMYVAAKRLFPTYMFLDSTFNVHELWDIKDPARYSKECSTMGCRTRVFENVNGEKTSFSRGNASFNTIDLPRIAIVSYLQYPEDENKRIEYFKNLLVEKVDLTKDLLLERFEYQSKAKAKQFPFLMGEGIWKGGKELDLEDEVREAIKSATLGIGFIGLAEALKMLIGKHHGESEFAQALGLQFISLMKKKADEYTQEYGFNFSVLATPAEGISGKFTKRDKADFGVIEGVTDREYYTNSNHVPVYYNCSAYHKIKTEAPYHELTLGGHILYIEMDTDAQKNLTAFMQIIKTMKDNNVGYGAINVPSCRCLKCGYDKPFEDKCPICGEETLISIIKRITGYLVGTIKKWNSYKKAELRDRVKHK